MRRARAARAAPRCLEGFDLKKKMKKRKEGIFGLVRRFKQKECMHAWKCRGNRGEIALLSRHKIGVVTTEILLYVLLYVLLRVFCYMFCCMFCCVFFVICFVVCFLFKYMFGCVFFVICFFCMFCRIKI